MAFLRDLIGVLAEQDARGFGTVDYVARALRKQRIVKPSVRGRGAARLDERDAAAVIIGLNCGETLANAPAATETFWTLTPLAAPDARQVPHALRSLIEARCFGDAITTLVIMAAELSALEHQHPKPISAQDPDTALLDGVDAERAVSIVVEFLSPRPAARIRVRSHVDPEGVGIEAPQTFDLHYRTPPAPPRHGERLANALPDRRACSTITLKTFEAVHACLFGASHG